MTNTPTTMPHACRVEVRKEGRKFYGDLIWSDGVRWTNWQEGFRTIKALTASVRCTFNGFIVRV